jgi:hypothetical protein
MVRNIPHHTKQPRKKIESDPERQAKTISAHPAPKGEAAFQEGWRECIEMYALHRPNKRGVMRILDEHCVILEDACIARPTRQQYARYEGFRAAMKGLQNT